MRIDIVTIFPEMFREVFAFGIVRRAVEAGLITVRVHDLREWTSDKHRSTDDAPYGGGPGMVMKVEPLVRAVESIDAASGDDRTERECFLLSPRGAPFTQERARELSTARRIVLVAGRYEGVDERFIEATGASELSIGDYVLSGGEIPAMVVVDAITRLLPGAVSDPRSVEEDSFSNGRLDHPHYTRPAEFRGLQVPEVLLSGNHASVRQWREEQAKRDTRSRRPELIGAATESSIHSSHSGNSESRRNSSNECHR